MGGATTHTSTRECGSATVSSCGAATSSATPAVRGQRCTRANERRHVASRPALGWCGGFLAVNIFQDVDVDVDIDVFLHKLTTG